MIQEYKIHRFIREHGGETTKQQIFETLGNDDESKRIIEGKLRMMERFGLVIIDGEEVKMKEKTG